MAGTAGGAAAGVAALALAIGSASAPPSNPSACRRVRSASGLLGSLAGVFDSTRRDYMNPRPDPIGKR